MRVSTELHGPIRGGRVAALVAATLLGLLTLSPPCAFSQEAEPAPPFDYVISISRGPDRRFFECRRVAQASARLTDPDVAGYFPYRFSPGDEHCVIIQPAESMPIYWLDAERTYRHWLELAASSLQDCEQGLIKLKDAQRELRSFEGYIQRHRDGWQRDLARSKQEAIARLGLDAAPEDLDMLELWGALGLRRAKLLETGAAPESAAGAPAQGPTAPEEAHAQRGVMPELPRVDRIRAIPAPNDNGTHVAVLWPVSSLDQPREQPAQPPQPAPPAAPSSVAERQLTAAEAKQLAAIERDMDALRPAVRQARRLADAKDRLTLLRNTVHLLADEYLGSVARLASMHALIDAETRVHVSAALAMEPGQFGLEKLQASMQTLAQRVREARRRAESPDALADDYDRLDGLSYAEQLAMAYLDQESKGVSVEAIENDLLWQLQQRLDMPYAAQPEEEAEAATTADLQEALEAIRRTGLNLDATGAEAGPAPYFQARSRLESLSEDWRKARATELKRRLAAGETAEPDAPHARRERVRISLLGASAEKRMKRVKRMHAARPYYFRLAAAPAGGQAQQPFSAVVRAAAEPAVFDASKSANLAFALLFAGAVLAVMAYVRRNPNVFVRRIAGLEAVDEAIGRATEMGKPALFVHGLTGVSDIAVLASINILSRISRQIAEYDSDLLVANNDPIVYSLSQEVVQEGYMTAGRPDAFNPDNVVMLASEQFPYVAAIAGIMSRRQPAANFFMGFFYAEALILAEVGARTGAIQIAATDSFTQIPFFITTCDYTLMGEELYAAAAYLSRNARMLATLKAQDFGKSILLCALPVGTALSNLGINWIEVLFTAYDKGF